MPRVCDQIEELRLTTAERLAAEEMARVLRVIEAWGGNELIAQAAGSAAADWDRCSERAAA